jgi:hypothetical protein
MNFRFSKITVLAITSSVVNASPAAVSTGDFGHPNQALHLTALLRFVFDFSCHFRFILSVFHTRSQSGRWAFRYPKKRLRLPRQFVVQHQRVLFRSFGIWSDQRLNITGCLRNPWLNPVRRASDYTWGSLPRVSPAAFSHNHSLHPTASRRFDLFVRFASFP